MAGDLTDNKKDHYINIRFTWEDYQKLLKRKAEDNDDKITHTVRKAIQRGLKRR